MNVVSISSVMRDVCRQNNACEAAICYFAVPQQIHQSPQYIYTGIQALSFCCVCGVKTVSLWVASLRIWPPPYLVSGSLLSAPLTNDRER